MSEKFDRKGLNRQEVQVLLAEQLGIAIEPICKEIGAVMEGFNVRLKDLEAAVNAVIEEVKQYKDKNIKVLQ